MSDSASGRLGQPSKPADLCNQLEENVSCGQINYSKINQAAQQATAVQTGQGRPGGRGTEQGANLAKVFSEVGQPELPDLHSHFYCSRVVSHSRPLMANSPANSLGTESLVTPITTPEPSGSPKMEVGDGMQPVAQVISGYDRYMQATPPVAISPYMAYPYYVPTAQPAVYLIHPHPSMMGPPTIPSYLPAMETLSMGLPPHDFSMPPPNYSWHTMQAAPHLHQHYMPPHMYHHKLSPSPDRLDPPIPIEMPIRENTASPEEVPRLSEVALESCILTTGPSTEEEEIVEITELIEEIKISPALPPQTIGSRPASSEDEPKSWYEKCTTEEQRALDESIEGEGDSQTDSPKEVQRNSSQDTGTRKKENEVRPQRDQPRQHAPPQKEMSQREYQDNYRRPIRESSGHRYEDRRSMTPDRRNNRGNIRDRYPRNDRRYSNPEHGANHLRSTRGRGRGDYRNYYEEIPSSREESLNRRDNRPRNYYQSPRRNEEYEPHYRYDGSLRRNGSTYRNNWYREDYNGNAELSKPIPRVGRNDRNERNDVNQNSRKPPLPRQESSNYEERRRGWRGEREDRGYRGSQGNRREGERGGDRRTPESRTKMDKREESFIEFLGDSVLGMNDKLDVRKMCSQETVRMSAEREGALEAKQASRQVSGQQKSDK